MGQFKLFCNDLYYLAVHGGSVPLQIHLRFSGKNESRAEGVHVHIWAKVLQSEALKSNK